MKKYKYELKSRHNNFVTKILNTRMFRPKIAHEIFNLIKQCKDGEIDFSTYAHIDDPNAELIALKNADPFIKKLAMCNESEAEISKMEFYKDLTQKLSDIVGSKSQLLKYFVPSDYIYSEKAEIINNIKHYYYLKSQLQLPAKTAKKIEDSNRPSIIQNIQNNFITNEIFDIDNTYDQSIIFNNMMTIDTVRQINIESIISNIKANYSLHKGNKIKKEEARIIEYFLSAVITDFDFTEHSKRITEIEKLYEIKYRTYRDYFGSNLGPGNTPKIEVKHLARAIIFVDLQISNNKHPLTFTVELLEKMVRHYEKLTEKFRGDQ